jgi:hypothetical protein
MSNSVHATIAARNCPNTASQRMRMIQRMLTDCLWSKEE